MRHFTCVVVVSLLGFALPVPDADAQTAVRHTLHIESAPNGYVTGPGIECGAGQTDCDESFFPEDVVELQATPEPGYTFLGWKGNVCIGGERARVINFAVDRSCTALFAAVPGSRQPESPDYSERAMFVESETVGIGPPLPAGTKNRQVFLPDAGGMTVTWINTRGLSFRVDSGFGEWGVAFAADRGGQLTVGAYDFISHEWVGGGEVMFWAPWGTRCGGIADDTDQVTAFTVDARPSRFVVHEIEVAAGTLQRFAADFEIRCTASLGVAGSIRYHSTRTTPLPFDQEYPSYRLMVDASVGGAVSAAGIDCGAGRPGPCRLDYPTPTTVTLTAEPFAGYRFMSWGGACQGSSPTTQVVVEYGRKCFAAFSPAGADPVDPALASAVWLVDLHRSGLPPVREFKWPEVARLATRFSTDERGNRYISTDWSQPSFLPLSPGSPQTRGIRLTFPPGIAIPAEYTEVYLGTNGLGPALEMYDSFTTSSLGPSTAFVCVTNVARLRVYEAVSDTSGRVVSFAADFEALCRPGLYTYIVGAIRFNSSRTSLEPFDGDAPLHQLNVERPVNGRIVTSGVDCGAGPHIDCTESFPALTDLTLQAIPGPGYEFVAWTGACKGAATTTFRLDWTRTCSAVFSPLVPGFGIEDPRAANAFFVDGAPGNTLVTGRHLYTNTAIIRPQPNGVHPTWVVVNVILPDGRTWTVKLRVPHDQVLRPGAFDARLFLSEPSAEPQLSVGTGFVACGRDLVGRFLIHEIGFATIAGTLTLTSLAVDFEQRCSAGAPPLSGALRYNAAYRSLTPFAPPVTSPPQAPVTRDFDADGWPDLVWRHRTSGRNALWLMQGASVKTTVALIPDVAARTADTDWEIRAIADFNGDTQPDLIWQHKTNGKLGVWFMSGATLVSAGSFATVSGLSVETDLDWKIVGAGDMNRDSQTDLFWRHQTSGALRVWHMSGLEQWDSVDLPLAVTDVAWEINGIGDMNGDGWLDLVWRHYGNGGLASWFLNDTRLAQAIRFTPASSTDVAWHIVGLADLNRDGQTDLVWQHYTDGRLGVWYMNGVEMTSAGLLQGSVAGNVDWRIVGVK